MGHFERKLNALLEARGLWDNIRAKRARGERRAKPGEKGYPKPGAFEKSQSKD